MSFAPGGDQVTHRVIIAAINSTATQREGSISITITSSRRTRSAVSAGDSIPCWFSTRGPSAARLRVIAARYRRPSAIRNIARARSGCGTRRGTTLVCPPCRSRAGRLSRVVDRLGPRAGPLLLGLAAAAAAAPSLGPPALHGCVLALALLVAPGVLVARRLAPRSSSALRALVSLVLSP